MAAEEASRADDWYRQALETAPDAMVIVDAQGKILYVNAQLVRLFGHSKEELLGRDLEILIPERYRGGHGAHVRRYFANPGARPMGSGLELFGVRADGSEIAIEVSLSPLHAGGGMLVSAAIRDISERKRAESAAKLASQRLSVAVESIQDALALFDQEDRLLLCNSAYRNLVSGVVAGPLVGMNYADLLDAWMPALAIGSDDERAQFRAERLASRKQPRTTFDIRTVDGRSLRVVDQRTLDGGLVKTIWDLTNDIQLAEELAAARVAAEAASAAKSDFLSSMSHELRTPMNAILGFAQLLQRDKKEPLSTRHRGRVDEILKGGEHLLRLIDDILDLSRIEAGATSISVEPVSIADVLSVITTTLGPMAARAGLSLHVDAARAGTPKISADRTRFSQILMNFGSNAIKYNRPGGRVTFSVSVPEVNCVRVSVSDTGMGIPADKQDKLFQPFQRAGQETGSIEGTGIGLVITKRLAELMNGRVGFRSVETEGSEFWVELPAVTELGSSPGAETVRKESADLPAIEGKRLILYVEDNPANVTFMRDMLGQFEYVDLITAPTAEMGIEIARARKPAVVIMDINLPGMSGVDALKLLRAEPATAAIPVVALTAAASARDRQRGEQAGFYRYLTKPVRVDELELALSELLSREN